MSESIETGLEVNRELEKFYFTLEWGMPSHETHYMFQIWDKHATNVNVPYNLDAQLENALNRNIVSVRGRDRWKVDSRGERIEIYPPNSERTDSSHHYLVTILKEQLEKQYIFTEDLMKDVREKKI